MSASPRQSLTLLIGALGGEGGGVLADWVVGAAHAADFPVQATSIPGVAQRTGATSYYIEIFPATRAALGDRRPVMCLAPTAGQVDVLVCSELAETARMLHSGFVTGRTTLIASTHRVYTTAEKMQMADGRFDSARAIAAVRAAAKRAILFDMETETAAAGTVISAVMFGALVGSGALPLARDAATASIRAGDKGVEQSLRGFAAGYSRAAAGERAPVPDRSEMRAAAPALPDSLAAKLAEHFPEAVRDIAGHGVARCVDYLDVAYANLYLDRLMRVLEADGAGGGAPRFETTRETARALALWMCYEDIARVAEIKSRPGRFAGIRRDAAANAGEPIRVIEFFKPGYDEIADILPEWLAGRVRAYARRRGRVAIFERGVRVQSTSAFGYAQLRLLAATGRLRRRSSRYAAEQTLIERWLGAVVDAGDRALALEIALLARLIKGYSDTHRRGRENFTRIFDNLVIAGDLPDAAARAAAVRAAREAALASPEAAPLDRQLARFGVAPRPVKAVPVRFHPRAKSA
jgi:indolepyruvate ferredoxin oxidoreductase beta subunit